MKAHVMICMNDGRQAETTTTRNALADFWQRHEDNILAAVVDICLTRWFWSQDTGWQKATKFRYTPNRPDCWKHDPKATDLKPTTAKPW